MNKQEAAKAHRDEAKGTHQVYTAFISGADWQASQLVDGWIDEQAKLADDSIKPIAIPLPEVKRDGIDEKVERGMRLVRELKHKTQLAIDEGSPYHETAEARTMAFEHGWDACKEYFGIK